MTALRDDFPILAREHRGKRLVYLDNAATTQKPQAVIDAVATYYTLHNANVHRATHLLAEEATGLLEEARELCRGYLNAEHTAEIIFTRGTTEGINLLAFALQTELQPGDEVLITALEHHSNIVPWQLLCQRSGARLRAVSVTPQGEIDLDDFHRKLGARTRILACGHVSNALGTVNPVARLIADAQNVGAITVIDGAQAALHIRPDVRALNCDFYAVSGHKMYAPTGIGALYGKLEWLERIPPWQGGGEMIETVTIESSTYQRPPYKFEAGTPNIGGAVGMGAAIRYLNEVPRQALVAEEDALVARAVSHLRQIPGMRLIGEPAERSAVVSFTLDGAHPHDLGTLLDQQGVAVRTGHHCAMPLMQSLGINGTVRASFSLYNDEQDLMRLLEALEKAQTLL